VKERPILFSAPMIRALLAGTKTQTRRIVKPVGNDDGFVLQDYGDGWWPYRSDDGESPFKEEDEIPHACPYGAPGDRLWVRETWKPSHEAEGRAFYRASWGNYENGDRWRPSIHMPRAASRITLEIVVVRVERLQDISEADAIAEGVIEHQTLDGRRACNIDGGPMMACGPIPAYRALWEQINGAGSWDENPWVWVVEFRRVTP
jgi:hypothetical protein